MAKLTQLHPGVLAGQRYGSFADKTPTIPVEPPVEPPVIRKRRSGGTGRIPAYYPDGWWEQFEEEAKPKAKPEPKAAKPALRHITVTLSRSHARPCPIGGSIGSRCHLRLDIASIRADSAGSLPAVLTLWTPEEERRRASIAQVIAFEEMLLTHGLL